MVFLPSIFPLVLVSLDVNAGPSDYTTSIATLNPGDTLHLASGTYSDCLRLVGLNGSANAPITIAGPSSGSPAVFTATNCQKQNTLQAAVVHLREASYIVIRDLEIDLQSLVVDGVEAEYA